MVFLRRAVILTGLLTVAATVFLAGIDWGLPSARVDAFLFGDRPVWTGRSLLQLAPADAAPDRGADVDANPLTVRDSSIVLNATDAQRAEIIRRYRLFTYQPDEMITLMSLARMRPGAGDLDPRLYQYGGLWVYGVGLMLRMGAAVDFLHLTADPAFYLDHPDAFGRFYVMARLYAALWGLVGVWTVHRLTRRYTQHRWPPIIAALLVILMPVVINQAHEAKPHLPGAVLMLLACLAAIGYARTGAPRWCIGAGILCGAAVGMVLSVWPIAVVIPLMALIRADPRRRQWQAMGAATGLLFITYFITNPFVMIHLVGDRSLLLSNLGNTQAMYGVLLAGIPRAARLMVEGMSPAPAILGIAGAMGLAWVAVRRHRPADARPARRADGWILAAPAILLSCQFALTAAGKPGEYGRFFLFPDMVLALAAALAVDRFTCKPLVRGACYGLLLATTAVFGAVYVRAYLRDAGSVPGRIEWADQLERLNRQGGRTLGVLAEPAPYSLPPVDLFDWQIILLPRSGRWGRTRPDLIVRAVDAPGESALPLEGYDLLPQSAPIQPMVARLSWADKPFEVWVRRP